MSNNKPQIQKSEIEKFQQEILSWYRENQRDLPWRHNRNPYHILVSEVMLQQTQVPRVIPKYKEWLMAFPTLESLANASSRDVLLHWSGLGYNRRALYLQKFAKAVVEQFAGKIPQDEKTLRTLPGVGEYTARALSCFAFDQQVAVVDTNIRKVIAVHFFAGKLPPKDLIDEFAIWLLPKGKAYEWNQALMDYASQQLKAHKIPIPKQSKFHDSDRYYRGQILRKLLKHRVCKKEDLKLLLGDISTMTTERFEKIISGMVKDGLVLEDKKKMVVSLEE